MMTEVAEDCDTKIWWKKFAIYQIYPRSFKDSSGSGSGDLKGIIEKLDYLEWLGVRAVWLSPIYTSPMKDFGYDVSDYTEIDPLFGSIADFDLLINKMHEKGMYLVMDLIPNHTSDLHEWFQKSKANHPKYADYFVWHPGKKNDQAVCTLPNNWQSCFSGPAWSWCPERDLYYLHQFLPEQPDLNFRNPAVRREILDVIKFWLDRGVDGFRIDSVSHLVESEDFADNTEGLNNQINQPET